MAPLATEVAPKQFIEGRPEILPDNHHSYKKSVAVRDVITALDAKHLSITPHCPRQNGEVERLNRMQQVERT